MKDLVVADEGEQTNEASLSGISNCVVMKGRVDRVDSYLNKKRAVAERNEQSSPYLKGYFN